MSNYAWAIFAGKIIFHLELCYHFRCVVGGRDYEEQVPCVRPARALYLEWGTELSLIAKPILFAGDRACSGGFSSTLALTIG